jgi:hypothetical protein
MSTMTEWGVACDHGVIPCESEQAERQREEAAAALAAKAAPLTAETIARLVALLSPSPER